MMLIDRIRLDAENQHWPPELFAYILNRIEALGVNLQRKAPLEPEWRWGR